MPAAQKGVSAPQPSRMDDKVGQDSQIQERQLQPQVPMRSAPPAQILQMTAVEGLSLGWNRRRRDNNYYNSHNHRSMSISKMLLNCSNSHLNSNPLPPPNPSYGQRVRLPALPPSYHLSHLHDTDAAICKTCRISFDYNPKMHTFEVVGRHLKHRFKLQDAAGKLKQKIQIEYEALKKGEDRSSFVEEDIAIMDDAAFLINRDMRQEILYKQIQRFSHQIRENDAQLLD